MIYGFTGTRKGMSEGQMAKLHALLKGATQLIHGGCIGADDEADIIAASLGIPRVIWPSNIEKMSVPRRVVELRGGYVTFMHQLPPLARNKCIVLNCLHLIAAPKSSLEELRSGTWATVRFARLQRKPLTILKEDASSDYPQDSIQHS